MYEQSPAENPDMLSKDLWETISCLFAASQRLSVTSNLYDEETYFWLVGAREALTKSGLDLTGDALRFHLLLIMSAIEKRKTDGIDIQKAIQDLLQTLNDLLKAHLHFFHDKNEIGFLPWRRIDT